MHKKEERRQKAEYALSSQSSFEPTADRCMHIEFFKKIHESKHKQKSKDGHDRPFS